MVSTPYEMHRVGYFLRGINLFTVTVCGTQAWEPLAQHSLKTHSWKCTLQFFIFTEIEVHNSPVQICNRFFFNLPTYSVSLTEWRSFCRFQRKFWYICSWNCLKFPLNQIVLIRYPWRWYEDQCCQQVQSSTKIQFSEKQLHCNAKNISAPQPFWECVCKSLSDLNTGFLIQ